MTLLADFVTGQSNVSYTRMRKLMFAHALQEGVVAPGDFKTTQRAAGANMSVDIAAGDAWVQTDIDSPDGLAHVFSDAIANVAVTASNATNPRIDRLVLRYNDTGASTGSGGNLPTLEVLAGTATAGAQATNAASANYLTGAAGIPSDALLIADIVVRAASTSVLSTDVVDRRKWARGAYVRLATTAGNLTQSSATMAPLDATNLQPRIECSGALMTLEVRSTIFNNTAAATSSLNVQIDGANQNLVHDFGGTGYPASMRLPVGYRVGFIPTAGTHFIAPAWNVSGGLATLLASGSSPLELIIEEHIRPNSSNT
jgi:hypothetical protein